MTEYESLPGFCKYMSDKKEVLKGIFESRKIRFTQPAALNDPLDCNPVIRVPSEGDQHSMYSVAGIDMPSENLWFHYQLLEPPINQYGVLSFTKNPVSADMWSQYANGHRGFLIEFTHNFAEDSAFRSKDGHEYEIQKVEYVDRFLIDLEDCLDASRRIDIETFRNLLFYRKAKRWAKEKEFRMIRPLKDLGKETGGMHFGIERDQESVWVGDLPFSTISSITFGAIMSRETKLWIIEQCKDTNVQFMQCLVYPLRLDDEGLSPYIHLVPLDNPELRAKMFDLHPQLLLGADEGLLGHKQITVSNPKELPYYQGYEKLVDAMYKKRKHCAKRRAARESGGP